MGFPIRKSTDQSLFAAPHGLSQRITSFIASCRQGIHRMPLRHLITLITNVHPCLCYRTSHYLSTMYSTSVQTRQRKQQPAGPFKPANLPIIDNIRPDSRDLSNSHAVKLAICGDANSYKTHSNTTKDDSALYRSPKNLLFNDIKNKQRPFNHCKTVSSSKTSLSMRSPQRGAAIMCSSRR